MPFLTAPVGNMQWIWQLSACEGGDIDRVIARAKANNVTTIAIKAFDGEWRYNRASQFSTDIVRRLHAAGISVAAWFYSVGDWKGPVDGDNSGQNIHDCTIAAEIENCAWAIAQGVDFLIIDPEKEWCYIPGKRNDPDAHARAWGAAYRARCGTFPIYAGIVASDTGYWVGNPTAAISEWADGTCPQVYTWSWGVDVRPWTDRAIALSHGKPCYPIYESSSGASVANMVDSARCARDRGCSGVSWWSWQHCEGWQWDGVRQAGAIFADAVAAALLPPLPPRLNLPYNDAENPAAWHCTATDVWVVHPSILERYLALGDWALRVFGLPISGAYLDPATGLYVQYFERSRFEVAADGQVTLGRVGAEALAAQKAA